MKISFDLDGTAYDHLEFFRELCVAMQSTGHKVGVLTGHKQESEEHDRDKLRSLGFPEIDFYFGRTPDYMHLNGAHYKTMIIKREGISVHFEDYDYDHPDTNRLFKELGQEGRIFRVRSVREMGSR